MRRRLRGDPRGVRRSTSRSRSRPLAPVTRVSADTIVAIAARLGRTRLIDNIVLGEGLA